MIASLNRYIDDQSESVLSGSEHKYEKASAIPTINDSHTKLRKEDC